MNLFRVFFVLIIGMSFYFLAFNIKGSIYDLFAESKAVKSNNTNSIGDSFSKLLQTEKIDGKYDVYILNFWASWCSPCMKELPGLNRLHHLYKDKKLKIITVNVDYEDQEKVINKTTNDLGLDLLIIRDKEGKQVENFKIEGLPVTMFFRDRELNDLVAGEIDFDSNKTLEKIDQLLKSSLKN